MATKKMVARAILIFLNIFERFKYLFSVFFILWERGLPPGAP